MAYTDSLHDRVSFATDFRCLSLWALWKIAPAACFSQKNSNRTRHTPHQPELESMSGHCSALGWAAKFGQKAMVEFLLQRGAKTNLTDDPIWATPLAWALRRGHEEIAELLKRYGAT